MVERLINLMVIYIESFFFFFEIKFSKEIISDYIDIYIVSGLK